MKVLCTGISGSGRRSYLADFENYVKKHGKSADVKIFDIGTEMFEKSEELRRHIPQDKILDLSPSHLDYLRAAALEDVVSHSQNSKHSIISTHACFRWKKHLTPAFDFYYLDQIKPDLYVTVIDDCLSIKASLESQPEWRGRLTLRDILIWRDEEIFLTKLMADYQRKKHYLISKSQPGKLLFDLLFKPDKRTVYLSYPMTHVKGDPKLTKQKVKFQERLEKTYVVFDPGLFEDTDMRKIMRDFPSKGKFAAIDANGTKVRLGRRDVEDCEEIIFDHIVIRDFRLIDQSDLVIVFYPVQKQSIGVVTEAYYGHTNNKHVYAFYPHGENPFMKYIAKDFTSEEELFAYLKSSEIMSASTTN